MGKYGNPLADQAAVPQGPTASSGGNKGGWLPAIASIAGSVIDFLSQRSANQTNAKNVQKQMDFQAEQSSTQYQRATKDMLAAGLNPALAYKQGGNQAEGGAAANALAATGGNRLAQAVSAYNEFANGTAQRQLIREQAGAAYAQGVKTTKEAEVIEPDAALGRNKGWVDQYGRTRMAKGRADIYLAEKTPEQWEANLRNTNQGTATAAQNAALMKTQATLNEQGFQNEYFRKHIAPYLNSSAATMKAVGDAMETSGYTRTRRYW